VLRHFEKEKFEISVTKSRKVIRININNVVASFVIFVL